MISFNQVTFTYPNAAQPALQNVSLQLRDGSFTLVVGESGSGKSTLLRCVNGLVPHFSGGQLLGDVRVLGIDPVQAGPEVMSQQVGFVLQDPEAQFVMDTVEDEIAFGLENRALPRQDIRVRVEEVLDLLDLEPLRARKLETLSGGERQRTAIASVLAMRPRVLVLDEPTSQLDPKSAEDVLNALVRLNADLGLTIVLSEHRLERVLPFVDTVVALFAPSLERELHIGTPAQVMPHIDLAPPLIQLAKALDWHPLPMTIKEGKAFSAQLVRPEIASAPAAAGAHTNMAPLLDVRHIDFGYGPQPVLKEVSLQVRAGEVLALLGRNGSGKSTLLKCIIGLNKPKRGEVRLDGTSTAGQSVAQLSQRIGYLPQDPNALLFADTVAEELAITLRNHHVPAAELQPRVAAALHQLGLADKAQRYPRDLSTGERQRVAFGAITITQPRVLLLDEPTRGLDYAAKRQLVRLLSEWRVAGTAIVLVTHDVEMAAEIADRVAVLSQGEVIAEGAPAEVLATSPWFAPQISRLFPATPWLTVEDVLKALKSL